VRRAEMNRDLLGKGWNMLPNIFHLWIIKAKRDSPTYSGQRYPRYRRAQVARDIPDIGG
jgi:hypothetical protein